MGSGVCYPDLLIGSTPNIYYYAANNPSEATIAKRRSYANTISYLTPPAENAGLYKGLKELKELISSYQSLKDSGRGPSIVNTIITTAITCNLDKDIKELPSADADAAEFEQEFSDMIVGKVYGKIMEIESRLLPCGLHVVGCPPSAEEAVATLVNIAGIDREEDGIIGMPQLLAQAITFASRDCVKSFVKNASDPSGRVAANALGQLGKLFGDASIALPWGDALKGTKFEKVDNAKMRTLFDYLRFCLEQVVKDNELGSLAEALDGRYVLPGPGGDPIRNPKVLPTGKNIHALDPQAIPTGAAVASAKVVVDRLIEREKNGNNGQYPESIALVLWGTDNIKTYGESLAQVMLMVGVRPAPDALGRVNKLELISLEELGRPRIDVVVNCSGVFRDLFVNQMNLLDR